MSETQPKSRDNEITERDLFGSIPKALDINPFEGINLDEIAVQPLRKGASEEERLIEINPIQDIDLEEISAIPVTPSSTEEPFEIVEINPIGEQHIIGLNDIHPSAAALATGSAVSTDRPSPSFKTSFLLHLKRLFSKKTNLSMEPSSSSAAQDTKTQPQQKSEKAYLKRSASLSTSQKAKSKGFSKPLRTTFNNAGFPVLTPQLVKQAFNYAEIYRIREKILSSLEGQVHKVVMAASPQDGTGNTFMVSVLGLNAASYTQLNLLMVDLNMRKPQLHVPFDLPLENGFGDIAQGIVQWTDVIKDTGLPNLKLISAGAPVKNLAKYLNKDFFESFLRDIKSHFDMVLLDTSPVLIRNRNNVDPILLGRMSDLVIVITRNKHTSRNALMNTVQAITQDGGNIIGIVYNH